MLEFKIAESTYLNDLKRLFMESFSASFEETENFFNNKFKLENCCICLNNKELVSALHLFDTYIFKNGKKYPVCYVYAVSTFKKYRNRGYMSRLIEFAHKVALKSGAKYLFLSPSSESLYSFYEKLGFKSFFKIREVNFKFNELKKYVSGDTLICNEMRPNIEKVRNDNCCEDGDIFWNKDHINYAIFENENCDGITFFEKNGYAICRPNKGFVDIIEFICDEYDFERLIFKILKAFKNTEYRFRLKVNSKHFKSLGKIKNFGMISFTGHFDELGLLKDDNFAYLGLALD